MSETIIRDEAGRLLVSDRSQISGAGYASASSPIGHWRIVLSVLLAGERSRLPSAERLSALDAGLDAIAGISALPNEAGLAVRCLAANAKAARRVLERTFEIAVEAAFGALPKQRRK